MQQSEGQAVLEECWRAAIPVQLRLAENEVSSLEQPPVLYFLVPRQSYLHGLVPHALRVLQHLLPPGELAPWFEHGHLPLKWNVPAGVLYDVVAAPSGELPWRLTLHFRGFPDRQLATYGGEASLRAAFFNSLKEAAVISRGSAQRVMEMAAAAQEELWRQTLASSLQPYRQVLSSLQLAPVAARNGRRAAVPLRLYVRRDEGGRLTSYEDIAVTSRPVEAQAPDGSSISLRQALLPLLAECLAAAADGPALVANRTASGLPSAPSTPLGRGTDSAEVPLPEPAAELEHSPGSQQAATIPAATEGEPAGESPAPGNAPAELNTHVAGEQAVSHAAGSSTPSTKLPDTAAEMKGDGTSAAALFLDSAASERRVLVGGVPLPVDTPLAWLHAHLHAADYFLYVVVHMCKPCM